jgi:hypothetical protein
MIASVTLGITLLLGVFALEDANEEKEQDSIRLEKEEADMNKLRQDRDTNANFIAEMKKEFSPVLINEARQYTGLRVKGERVLNLNEER